VDEDFGPFFLKFSSDFPYNAKLCIKGHEYLNRQLAKKGIAFEALDNGILSCEDPKRLAALCETLTPQKIDALLRKWLALLPHPFTPKDRQAGYRYNASILQAEFSLTQVLERPVHGRVFFEEVIRENLDLGRPDQIQLIFERRVIRGTPGRFRTRVITQGVIPSLYVDYKKDSHQAISQGRPGAAHRDHHQRYLRLRCRAGAEEPAGARSDRIRRQPPPARGADRQARLHARRRHIPTTASPRGSQ
jgi:hypothetical protein